MTRNVELKKECAKLWDTKCWALATAVLYDNLMLLYLYLKPEWWKVR